MISTLGELKQKRLKCEVLVRMETNRSTCGQESKMGQPGKLSGSSLKCYTSTYSYHEIQQFHPQVAARKKGSTCPHKYLDTNVHSTTGHEGPKVDTTYISFLLLLQQITTILWLKAQVYYMRGYRSHSFLEGLTENSFLSFFQLLGSTHFLGSWDPPPSVFTGSNTASP